MLTNAVYSLLSFLFAQYVFSFQAAWGDAAIVSSTSGSTEGSRMAVGSRTGITGIEISTFSDNSATRATNVRNHFELIPVVNVL